MNKRLVVAVISSLVVAGVGVGLGDETAASALTTKLVTVSLFKNGLGFAAREGALPQGNVSLLIEGLPVPSHGTFWVYSPKGEAIVKDVVGFEQETAQRVGPISLAELIEANVGQTVDVRLNEKETLRATILAVATNRPAEAPEPIAAPYGMRSYAPPSETASLVLLQTASGTVALNKNAIQQLTSVDSPLKTVVERRKRSVALRLNAANPNGKGRVVVQYLAKGITWAPSCAVDLTDPTKAQVTAKAEIINEIEDLDGVTVNFITGYPNLQFADVTDPMAMRGDLAAFLGSLLNPTPPGQFRGRRGAVTQQAVISNLALAEGDMFPAYANVALEGQAREELFFYEQKGVTLKKGERGYYPLFTMDVPYEHVYEWKIGDVLDEQERYRNREPREPEKPEEVWHSVRLTNTGKVPWTTAPALTMQGGQVLGQDLIYYTSVGAKTMVKITQAVDIRAEQAEYEVERKRNAANFYGYNYDLVEVKGRLKASNFKNKDITITITKDLSGDVVKTSPEAKVEQVAHGLKKVNPHSVLNWELPIQARDKIEIQYHYKVYVRD